MSAQFAQVQHEPGIARPAGVPRGRTAEAGSAALGKLGIVVRFARNETIFNQGDETRYSYEVVSGGVRLSKMLLNGRRQIADFALPADLFGFESTDEYSLTAEALCDVVVVRYSRSHIERLGEEIADVRRQLTASLRRELQLAQNHLVMLGRQSAKERVAAFLVLLAGRSAVDERGMLDLPMGRQDIADYLGLTIETVCRAISEFRHIGLIAVPNRHAIRLLRPEALERYAEADE